MRHAIFLSVRDKATRLPGKITHPIMGKKVIEHLIDRLKCSKKADLLVMTTSTHIGDNSLVDIARNANIECFRGSEDDKLQRYLDAAKKYNVDFAVIVDGDDLFCDPTIIDDIFQAYEKTNMDYIIVDRLPVGVTGFGIKVEALKKVIELKKEEDTEVWGKYFTENTLFKSLALDPDMALERPDYRLTLDYEEDLQLFKIIFDNLYDGVNYVPIEAIVNFLDSNKDVAMMNLSAARKYEEKIKEAQNKIDRSVFI